MRILIAGFLGSIAMFAWMSIAHMATPLSYIGFSPIPNQAPVLQAMESDIAKPGLYIYPWTDPKAADAMAQMQAKEKAHGHGLLLYTPALGNAGESMAPMMIQEYLKELAQALIASFIVAGMGAASFARRWGTVVLIGASAAIATNVSYWTWYHFPPDFTLAAIVMELVSAAAAGLVIAWWLGRSRSVA